MHVEIEGERELQTVAGDALEQNTRWRPIVHSRNVSQSSAPHEIAMMTV